MTRYTCITLHVADEEVLDKGQVQERVDKVTIYKEERDFLTIKFPLRNQKGDIFGLGGIATDITDRTRYENELKLARKTAEDAKRAQERFLANISHELRSPINGVVGMSNLLDLTPLTDDQKEYTELIRSSSTILIALINDILDLSKMQAGMLHLEKIPFDFRILIDGVILSYKAKSEEKNIKVYSCIDSAVPTCLVGDPTRLSQIISNLLSNAVKFTNAGEIRISAEQKTSTEDLVWLEIKVIDTGTGIPYEVKEKIFDSYVQSNTSISRQYGGTGLGLAIIKELAQLQSGEVRVESELGVGSTFSVTLPFGLSSEEVETEIEGPPEVLMLEGKNILVIDDNSINQRVAKESLESAGMNVEVADNGFVGLFLLKQHVFDAILLDINMPGMDGYETARKIRNELKLKIPIIAVTANVLNEDRDLCYQVGMTGFISKPYSISELLTEINRKIR